MESYGSSLNRERVQFLALVYQFNNNRIVVTQFYIWRVIANSFEILRVEYIIDSKEFLYHL